MKQSQVLLCIGVLVTVLCSVNSEEAAQAATSDTSIDHQAQKRSAMISPEGAEGEVILPEEGLMESPYDDEDDMDKRSTLFRFGKRQGSLLRFGKRQGSLFRFGKRQGSLFRFGKRQGSIFRYGKRGSLFRYGKRGVKRSASDGLREFDLDLLREALIQNDLENYPSYTEDVADKRVLNGFHWGRELDEA